MATGLNKAFEKKALLDILGNGTAIFLSPRCVRRPCHEKVGMIL